MEKTVPLSSFIIRMCD